MINVTVPYIVDTATKRRLCMESAWSVPQSLKILLRLQSTEHVDSLVLYAFILLWKRNKVQCLLRCIKARRIIQTRDICNADDALKCVFDFLGSADQSICDSDPWYCVQLNQRELHTAGQSETESSNLQSKCTCGIPRHVPDEHFRFFLLIVMFVICTLFIFSLLPSIVNEWDVTTYEF